MPEGTVTCILQELYKLFGFPLVAFDVKECAGNKRKPRLIPGAVGRSPGEENNPLQDSLGFSPMDRAAGYHPCGCKSWTWLSQLSPTHKLFNIRLVQKIHNFQKKSRSLPFEFGSQAAWADKDLYSSPALHPFPLLFPPSLSLLLPQHHSFPALLLSSGLNWAACIPILTQASLRKVINQVCGEGQEQIFFLIWWYTPGSLKFQGSIGLN